MVKTTFRFILLSLLFILHVSGEDVKVTANMSEYSLVEGEPLQGTISVTHDNSKKIDIESFRFEGKPLKVEFVRDVKISPDDPLVISIYYFKLPPSKQGLHVLEAISVKVDNKEFQSPPTTYQVSRQKGVPAARPAQPAATQQSSAKPSIPPTESQLRIEAKVDGPTTLYPGQRTKFIYRFIYSGYIELLKETLPMLEAAGLKKIGTTQNRDYLENGLSVSEFTQEVEADQPGKFTFGPSIVEGTAYAIDSAGNKTYSKKILHSEAPPITITVEGFPEKDKPASFNGAIGQFLFTAALISEPKAVVGDKVVLSLEMVGDPANFSTLSAPDLCCQPGFSGMFKPSDLPPTSNVQENTKRFTVTLRPLSSAIKEIPPIEFSSWDPTKSRYVVQKSAAIPLIVTEGSGAQPMAPLPSLGTENNQMIPSLDTSPQPIEIQQNEDMSPGDLGNKWGGTWWVLLLIPVVLGLIYLQKNVQQEVVEQQNTAPGKKAEAVLKEALKASPDSPLFYQGVRQALILLLAEKRIIPDASVDPEKLPQQGPAGEIRTFLMKLNASRFAKNPTNDPLSAVEAEALFKKIQG